MPDRLSDIINVKDWGAVGNGRADDQSAIQSAIDEAIRRGGGRVFFPPGNYRLNSPGSLTVGSSNPKIRVDLIGSGKTISQISGNTSGALISRGSEAYDNLGFMYGFALSGASGVGSGLIKLEGNCQTVSDIHTESSIPTGGYGVDASNANNALISEWSGGGATGVTAVTRHAADGTIGFYLGNSCCLRDCRLQGGLDIAVALSGVGACVINCEGEVNNIGIRAGWGPGGEATAYGFSIIDWQSEQTDSHIELYNCQGGIVQSVWLQGGVGTTGTHAATISNMTWDGATTATVTTAVNHNIPAGNIMLQLFGSGAGPWIPSYITPGGPAWIVAQVDGINLNKFTYDLPNDPGVFSGPVSWAYPQKYGIRFRKCTEVALMGFGTPNRASYATLDFDYDGEAQNHRNNVIYGAPPQDGVRLPRSGNTILAGWTFFGCNGAQNITDGHGWRSSTYTVACPEGHMAFADLPGQSGYQPGPTIGQEFIITDSNLANTAGNFAARVSGGSSNTVKVRWSGSNWTISG
jgi:hypothetical protein